MAENTNEFQVPLLKKPPVLDGKFSPEEWQDAVGFDGMSQLRGKLDERSVRSYVGATADAFYVAISSELPPGESKLIANVKKNISKVVHDDSFELWFDPDPASEKSQTFQMLFNSLGNGCYLVHTRGGAPDVPGWKGEYEMKNGFTADAWITEVKIPVASITPNRSTTEGTWGISVCRNWKQPWQQTCAPGKNFKGRDTRFNFTAKPIPVVKLANLNDPFTRDIQSELTVYNPDSKEVKVNAKLELERNSMPTITKDKELSIKAGKTTRFLFKHKEQNSDAFGLNILVTSPDGKTIYYKRQTAWAKPRKKRWDTTILTTRPIDFQFAYYPYRNKLRLLADITGIGKGAKVDSLTFTITKQWDSKVLKTLTFTKFVNGLKEETIKLPELDGTYEITMIAKGTKVPTNPLRKTFIRKRYPWERNKLGRSTKVYPPFTPIEVTGKTIKTVFRDHTVNNLGLPEQISIKGKKLLAGPITLEAKVEEKDAKLKSKALKFTESAPHIVKTKSEFSAGALSATADAIWDYDGTLRYELNLLPTKGKTINELTLQIPFHDSMVPMIHAMIEGLRRGPISENLPKGNGTIWTSSKLLAGDMPPGFCSYIFLGSALRGLCWFAENDLNWGWDRKTPNIELIRDNKTLTMKINLINEPTIIDKPRTITFGLLAAPVKPRIPNWRTFWWTNKCAVLGTSINWLAGPGICGNVYPVGKDPYFWRFVGDANIRPMSKEETNECIERGLKYFAPYEMEDRWIRHVKRQGSGARLGKFQIFYYNRATTACDEEYATFINEWSLADYPSHDYKILPWEIKIIPSESYMDFALHWYAKSFEYGRNQGVYWDNWYMRPGFNTEMTDAYVEGDNVIPATGIWEMRELCKRTFVMMNEKGMIPITMPHMTSTNILPMHSFATVQYDWEWKYSTGDVQYRHTREYLQLCSNGELAGIIPVPLHDHGKQAKDEWIQRTFVGVCLIHELETGGYGKAWKTLKDPLIPIMNDPKVKVWRYWDETPSPVITDTSNLPGIVYSVPGKETRVIICSYSEKDENPVIKIDPKKLGFANGKYKVSNFETGKNYPVKDNTIKLKLKKHDSIGLLIEKK